MRYSSTQSQTIDKMVDDVLFQPTEEKKIIIRPKSAASRPIGKLKLRVK
jgi:hypothetical protein